MFSKQIQVFIMLNFLITWGFWGIAIGLKGSVTQPGSITFVLYVLGGLLGPVIAAFIAKKRYSSREEYKFFLKSICKGNIHYGWYVLAFLLPLILTFTPRFTHFLVTGELDLSMNQGLWMAILTLPTFIIGGGLEEVGWRGVLLPKLLEKFSPFVSTLMVVPLWAIWHVPLWFMNGTVQNGTNFILFLLGLAGTSLVLTVLYFKTKSIFLCILFHALTNSFLTTVGNPAIQVSSSEEMISSLIKLVICVSVYGIVIKLGKKKTLKIETSTAI